MYSEITNMYQQYRYRFDWAKKCKIW